MNDEIKKMVDEITSESAPSWEQVEEHMKVVGGSVSRIKKGDCVVNFSEDENLITIGFVSEIHNEQEHDIEFFDGGTVSPVDTKDSFVVPENFARWLDKFLPEAGWEEVL